MAFTDLGSLGATGSTANNQTTLDLTMAASVTAGDFVVVVVGADNISNGGDDNAVTGVTLGVGGQALTKSVQIANSLSAQAGASCSIWYGVATGMPGDGLIRATFGSATLVDASAMTARRFSIGAGNTVAIEGTPGTRVSNTGADPSSLNVTTANIECLRVCGLAAQVGNNTNLTPTSTWTAWTNGNSATSGTTGEICARAEHLISTGTGAASDPTYVSAIHASVYVAFKEVLGPITGTLGATEAPDTVAITGAVAWNGALAATDAPDSVSLTGDIGAGIPIEIYPAFSPRALNDQITFNFGATAYAATAPSGYLNWEEEPALEEVTGTLGAIEAPDTALVNGAVRWDVTLAASEAPDTVLISGAVRWNVTLLAVEAPDTALINGTTQWNVLLAAIEAPDTALINGTTQWNVLLAASEAPDAVAITGSVFTIGEVSGSLTALEAPDTALINGAVTGIAGILTASEAPDTAIVNGAVHWSVTLAATEAPDTAAITGAVRWDASLAATEAPDIALINGATRWDVILAATEAPDAVNIAGSVFTLGEIAGSLVGLEAPDTALIDGAVTGVAGTLTASEAPDVVAVTGSVLDAVTAILNALEAPDAILITGTVPVVGVDGILAASEATDTAVFLGDVVIPEVFSEPEVLRFGRKIFLARW